MGGDEEGEDTAAADERDDGYADARGGGEDPDEHNEGADAEAEVWRDVDFGEEWVLETV